MMADRNHPNDYCLAYQEFRCLKEPTEYLTVWGHYVGRVCKDHSPAATLPTQPRADDDEPSSLEMVEDLHRAVFGDTWARPEPPAVVWAMLLDRVRYMAKGACGECIRRHEGKSA